MSREVKQILATLRDFYGAPSALPPSEPFEEVLWDNVAYMVNDARRRLAFRVLRERVGTAPEAIMGARQEALIEVAAHGIMANTFADKIRSAAAIALELGDLKSLAGVPVKQARRVLRRFPGIGEPGADRILLFSRLHAVPALDSNGCRVLQRLLSVSPGGAYAQVYRAEAALILAELGPDFEPLIEAYQLLRQHGQALCRRSFPRCHECPLRGSCDYYAGGSRRPS